MDLDTAWAVMTREPATGPERREAAETLHRAVRAMVDRHGVVDPADVDDLVQQVMFRVLATPRHVRRSVRGLLRSMVRTAVIDRYRERLRERPDEAVAEGGPGVWASAPLQPDALVAAREEAMAAFEEAERELQDAIEAVGARLPGRDADSVWKSLQMIARGPRGSERDAGDGTRPDPSRLRKARHDRQRVRAELERRIHAAWSPSVALRFGLPADPPPSPAVMRDHPDLELLLDALNECREPAASPVGADCLRLWLAIRLFENRYASYRLRASGSADVRRRGNGDDRRHPPGSPTMQTPAEAPARPLPDPEVPDDAEARSVGLDPSASTVEEALAMASGRRLEALFPPSLVRAGFEVRRPVPGLRATLGEGSLLVTADRVIEALRDPSAAGRWQTDDRGDAGFFASLTLPPGARAVVGDPATGEAVELARARSGAWSWAPATWGPAEARHAFEALSHLEVRLPDGVDPGEADDALDAAARLGRALRRVRPAGPGGDPWVARQHLLAWRDQHLGPAVPLWCAVGATRALAAMAAELDRLHPDPDAPAEEDPLWEGGALTEAGERVLARAAALRGRVEDYGALDDRWIDWEGRVSELERRLHRLALDSRYARRWSAFGWAAFEVE